MIITQRLVTGSITFVNLQRLWNETCSFFKTDEFSKEFDDVINALRLDDKYGKMLGDRTSLSKYCHDNAKQYTGDD